MSNEKILLVEGVDDFHVVLHLQGNHGIRVLDKSSIRQLGGIEPLLESLPVQLKASDGGIVGIVVDADQDFDARWQAIRHCLVVAGYDQIPIAPDRQGMILTPPHTTLLPKFGAWLMPDNSTEGILEDFLRFLVPTGDVLLPYAEATLVLLRYVMQVPHLQALSGWRFLYISVSFPVVSSGNTGQILQEPEHVTE